MDWLDDFIKDKTTKVFIFIFKDKISYYGMKKTNIFNNVFYKLIMYEEKLQCISIVYNSVMMTY